MLTASEISSAGPTAANILGITVTEHNKLEAEKAYQRLDKILSQ
jgi:hypothetical protein